MSGRAALSRPQILAVAPGDPLDAATWSGSSANLFGEFARRGLLAGAVYASLPGPLDVAARGLTAHPSVDTWRERSSLGRFRAGTTRVLAARRARSFEADALVQVGSWQRPPRLGDALRTVYLDSSFAQLLQRPDNAIPETSAFARWRLAFERSVYEQADLVFVMSEWTRRSVLQNTGLPAHRVVVASPGPNSVGTVYDQDRPRRPWAAGRGPHLLFVGKKWERKGGPEVAAAFAQLRRVCPGAHLSVIGPTSPVATGAGIRWWGRIDRSDPNGGRLFEALFASADLFVMPSRYEPFGIAFVEAMTRGLACVASDRCAMPEIVDDGVTGRIVAAQDAGALAQVLIELARDPDRVVEMGSLARDRAQERFTWPRCADAVTGALVTGPGAG